MAMRVLRSIVVIFVLFIFGCENNVPKTKVSANYQIIIIDSCEYIIYDRAYSYEGYGFMAHKGNCINH